LDAESSGRLTLRKFGAAESAGTCSTNGLTKTFAERLPLFSFLYRLATLGEHTDQRSPIMPSVKELREKRAALAPRLREIADKAYNEKRDLSAEEQANWEAINKDVDALARDIKRLESVEELEKQLDGDGNDPEPGRHDRSGKPKHKGDAHHIRERGRGDVQARDTDLAVNGWMRRSMGFGVSKRQAEAAERVGIKLNARQITVNLSGDRQLRSLRQQRALSAISLGSGGSFVPQDTLLGRLEMALLDFGGVKEFGAEVIRTDGGDQLTLASSNDTSNEGELITENQAVGEADATTGGIRLGAYKCSSKMQKVPSELLEDASFDVAGMIGANIGERIARRENRECTTGSGANAPKGAVTAATLGVTAASQTAITDSELIRLVHSVDPAYRNTGNCKFMFHDTIALALRLLRDGDGNLIWQQALSGGQPDRLLNFPVVINQHMASSIATTNKTILFGDGTKIKIREVRSLRIKRLVERYADSDQEGFIGYMRFDCNLQDAGTNPLKYLQQA
jgi:HK97 family phage major capsid protein